MKSLYEIRSILKNNQELLLQKYPIKSMAIFGSYARDEQIDESDVDIMVEFKDKIGILFMDLAEEIECLIGIKVDLVSKNGIKEKYYKAIESDLIYV